MIEKRRLARNALAKALQTLAGAGLLFALYRYINTTLGVEQLGVWSVVLATVSASRLADLGLSTGVTRFVARDLARGEPNRACQVINTATLTLMVSVGAALPLLYLLIAKLLPHLLGSTHLSNAQEILPFALVSLWLSIVAAVFQGGLDGCQRMGLHAGLVVTGQALLLVLAVCLVPQHGLMGLAWAQIGQALFLTMVGRLLMHRALPELPRLPLRWNKHVLREMLCYGANVQAASVSMLLFDPIAKVLMARFGGPAAAGYFEIASQVVLKARAVIVAANQAVVPHIAALAETKPTHLAHIYLENTRLLIFVSLPTFALLIGWAGGISWLLVGAYQTDFVFLLSLLAVAWGWNIIACPAFFTNMATGQVGWNTLSHVIMGLLNVGLGWLLGSRYGAHGVALAYAIALVIGSGVLIAIFQCKNRLGWRWSFIHEHLGLTIVCVLVAVFSWLAPLRALSAQPAAIIGWLFLSPLMLGLAVWFHPMRKQLVEWLISRQEQA